MSDALRELRARGPDPALESQAFGHWCLEHAGMQTPAGLTTVSLARATRRVPWARRAEWMIVADGEEIVLWPLSSAVVEPGENLAGEERDTVRLDGVEPVARAALPAHAVQLRGALVRSVLIAHALEKVCEMSIAYARERHQFGRPIGSFQAVQAHLVTIAQQTAIVGVAVDAAVARQAGFEIAAAARLAASAAITAGRAAHQVHGARGVTRAHPLGVQTRRLWSWRSEWAGARGWAERLGAAAARAGAERLYPAITGGSRELEV